MRYHTAFLPRSTTDNFSPVLEMIAIDATQYQMKWLICIQELCHNKYVHPVETLRPHQRGETLPLWELHHARGNSAWCTAPISPTTCFEKKIIPPHLCVLPKDSGRIHEDMCYRKLYKSSKQWNKISKINLPHQHCYVTNNCINVCIYNVESQHYIRNGELIF